jgi:N-formylmaleamate deformylase
MGGMTAAVAAARLGLNARALILIDPTFISPEWQREVYESNIVAEHKQLLARTKEELISQARCRSPKRPLEMIELLVEARTMTSLAAFDILKPPNPDYRALVSNFCVPTLLVIAENGVISIETASELQKLNPLLRYHLVAGAGHGVPYDEPEKVSLAILSFLGG